MNDQNTIELLKQAKSTYQTVSNPEIKAFCLHVILKLIGEL